MTWKWNSDLWSALFVYKVMRDKIVNSEMKKEFYILSYCISFASPRIAYFRQIWFLFFFFSQFAGLESVIIIIIIINCECKHNTLNTIKKTNSTTNHQQSLDITLIVVIGFLLYVGLFVCLVFVKWTADDQGNRWRRRQRNTSLFVICVICDLLCMYCVILLFDFITLFILLRVSFMCVYLVLKKTRKDHKSRTKETNQRSER